MRNPLRRKYSRYTYRARSLGIPFDLTLREFCLLVMMPCYNCGQPGPNGVDRMDNTGYHIHTTMPLCGRCNAEKGDMPWAVWRRRTSGGGREYFLRRRK